MQRLEGIASAIHGWNNPVMENLHPVHAKNHSDALKKAFRLALIGGGILLASLVIGPQVGVEATMAGIGTSGIVELTALGFLVKSEGHLGRARREAPKL